MARLACSHDARRQQLTLPIWGCAETGDLGGLPFAEAKGRLDRYSKHRSKIPDAIKRCVMVYYAHLAWVNFAWGWWKSFGNTQTRSPRIIVEVAVPVTPGPRCPPGSPSRRPRSVWADRQVPRRRRWHRSHSLAYSLTHSLKSPTQLTHSTFSARSPACSPGHSLAHSPTPLTHPSTHSRTQLAHSTRSPRSLNSPNSLALC